MNRLEQKLNELHSANRKALVVFITAGFPDMETTLATMEALEKAGVDVIEIGVPFSDPIADGPVIQASSDAALKAGVTLESIFALMRRARQKVRIPVLLMSYCNPLFAGGFGQTAKKARASGVDGFIIPDLIPEEGKEIKAACDKNNLSLIYLAAPNTPAGRLASIGRQSGGFVYVVSLTGVTGKRKALPQDTKEFLLRTKKEIHRPRFLGFGISNAEQAGRLRQYVDGIIVGSAFIELLKTAKTPRARAAKAARFASSLRRSIDMEEHNARTSKHR
ncbi:MAG: tryptophan synthase subunit alpha [Elusimicrobia bacterium RIFOXYA2_FULL_50_26]|nr:MAG: tryptophan synthase subunit alpha [Elusimicrobia bacterium RIFOXYA2_FULL_50_26]OGS24388.1 MAG: tryptophan synthase subunit alpha [Elusimicrobia bacterium RIFOXYB2_FULL_50_12]